jgi:type VI secretion system protein ImpA
LKLLDPSELVAAIADDSPCGPSIEYDAEFVALAAAARGKEGVELGDNVIAPEPPDWRKVAEDAAALLDKSRDLRLLAWWSEAAVELEGWRGLSAGLELFAELLENRWESIHPLLDEEDSNDPTARVNSMAFLTSTEFLYKLRLVPLVSSRSFGKFGIREIESVLTSEKIPTSQEESNASGDGNQVQRLTDADVRGAIAEADPETTANVLLSLEESVTSIARIDEILTEKAGRDAAMDFSPLVTLLKKAKSMLVSRSELIGGGDAVVGDDEQLIDAGVDRQVASAPGQIRSRADVVRALDAICAYYAKHEPSSPVPLIMKRARLLVSMGFLDIVDELAPGAVDSFALLNPRAEQRG